MLNTIKSWFNFEIIALKKLNGYDNTNYRLTTKAETYIFKTYTFTEDLLALVEVENSILQTLKRDQSFPEPIPFATGDFLKNKIFT